MRILLTNDDGYDAPGLPALYEAVSSLPNVEVDVIAPAVAQSGKGHSVSSEFSYRHATMDPMGKITILDGTPADCIRAALHLPGRPRPDWVIVGINRGSNLGIDIYYSATVAAAREAAILGIPAMAISQLVKTGLPDDWLTSARQAAAVIAAICRPDLPAPDQADAHVHRHTLRALQNQPLSAIPLSADQPVAPVRPIANPLRPRRPGPVCWNVNLPRLPGKQPPAGVQVVAISTDPLAFEYTRTPADDQSTRMTYVGRYHERPATPGTDVAANFAGYVTLSLLTLG
jgi:broad specificity polyphosphatase/5'/3'-nucleotidase SurE